MIKGESIIKSSKGFYLKTSYSISGPFVDIMDLWKYYDGGTLPEGAETKSLFDIKDIETNINRGVF
jgi:hypothetical protein